MISRLKKLYFSTQYLIFAFYSSFMQQFFEKSLKKFSKPYIPEFLLFIAFLSNNFSEKSLKFSKTAPSAPFSGFSRPKTLQP